MTKKSDKTPDWGSRVIRFIRMNWQPLISQDEAAYGMSYLLAQQDMTFIRNLFQNTTRINLTNQNRGGGRGNNILFNSLNQPIQPQNGNDEIYLREMRNLDFKPLPIWEKLRNVLIAEMKKMGVILDVRSADPTSTAKRMLDRGLIENKKEIENFLTYIYTSIGQAPYKMKDHQARFGEKPDNGNAQQFDAMGLNPGDPSDVDFFMKEFHKLDEEIAIQDLIEYVVERNQWNLDIEKMVNDIVAKKAVASTCYVSEVTGEIITRYLAPETVYIYGGGNRQDFNDANAKGYERRVSVKEMLDIFGDAFDMDTMWPRLLQAITYTNQIEFTAVGTSYRGFVGGNERLMGVNGNQYSYNDFMNFRIAIGRIEFNSQNQETFGEAIEDAGFYQSSQSPNGKYPSKARWETPTYKADYLVISQLDQILFNFGPLEYQDILGSTDVNVWSTICCYKDVGDSLTVQSAQIIDMINEAWYKFRYELRRAKPRGRMWNYDSMISSLMEMIDDTNMSGMSSVNKLQKVMEMMDSSSNEIYKYPVIDGKTQLITPAQASGDIPNGMSKESMLWWEIMMNGIQYLSDMIGIAPLREGDPGNPRDSMNNQFKALEYSQSATYYIPDMLTYLFQQMAVKANFFAQDIVTYKDYNTLAYKVLEDAVGESTMDKISSLGKTALHRFGVFVESLNQIPLRQKVDQLIALDVQKGTITTAESLLINDIKSPKKAYITLAYFEQRNRKLAEQAQQQQAQQAQQAAVIIEQVKQKTEMIKGDYAVMVAKIQAEAMQKTHAMTQDAQLAKQKMKIEGDSQQIYEQAHADLLKEQATNTTAENQPTPNIPQPPAPQPRGPVFQPQQPPSGPQQLRDSTIPGNTQEQAPVQ